jgi:hypothetical protein
MTRKPLADYNNAELRSMFPRTPFQLIDDLIQTARLRILEKHGDGPIDEALVRAVCRLINQENDKAMKSAKLIPNNIGIDNVQISGTVRGMEIVQMEVMTAIALKVVHAMPFVFKGKVTVTPHVMEEVADRDKIQEVILYYAQRILEDHGHDRYGIIDGTRRFNTWRNGCNERRYPSLLTYHAAVFRSVVSYYTLLKAEKEIALKEKSICKDLYNVLQRDYPEQMAVYYPANPDKKSIRYLDKQNPGFWAGPELIWYNSKRSYINKTQCH